MLARRLVALVVSLLPIALAAQSWRAEADAAIREHRMAPLTVTLSGSGAADATVRVYQTRQAFHWGTVVRIDRTQGLENDGVPVGGDDPYFQHLLDFNSVTPGNAGKWKFWERGGSREQYGEVAAWLRDNGVRNRGHGAIWPSIERWNAVPADVRDMTDSTDAAGTVLATRNERIRRRVREHLTSYMRTMAAWGVYEVDLVNELLHEGDLYRDVMALDDGEVVAELAQWHRWAHEAAPEVELVANEYDLYQSGGGFVRSFVPFVQSLIDAGAPITRVGMQGHFFAAVPSYAELTRRLDAVAELGLPMAVTEFDMADNSADGIERALYAVFSHPDAYGFTVWGAWDGQQWRGNAPVYFGNWSLKPNGERYVELVRERWRTDTTFAYGASAKTLRAYHGDYVVSAERADGSVVTRAATLTPDGLALEIDLDEGPASPRPEATLTTGLRAGERVLSNQPITLTVATEAPVRRVAYYVGDVRRATRYGEAGTYEFRVPRADSVRVSARVEFESGYVEELPALSFDVDFTNAPPRIVRVLPGSGFVAPQADSLYVEVLVADRERDAVTGQLIGAGGTVIAEAAAVDGRIVFFLADVPPGFNRYRIVVEDERFGRREVDYVLSVPEGEEAIVTSESSPLNQNSDIEERSNGDMDATGDLDLGQNLTAVRFLPRLRPGVEIEEAYVQFANQKSDQSGAMTIEIQAERAGRPQPLTTARANVTSRALTEATVTWPVESPWADLNARTEDERTPDLSPLLTEVTQLDGFDANSAVVLVFGIDTAGAKRSAYSVDQSAALAPVLTVRYAYGATLPQETRVTALAFAQSAPGAGSLNWDVSGVAESVLYYEVYLEDEAPRLTEDATLFLEGLEPERDYTARVRAVTSNGGREAYTDLTFNLMASALRRAAPVRSLRVGPSPARERVTVTGAPAGALTVVDALGRIVAADSIASDDADVPVAVGHLAAGVYRVLVTTADGLRWRGTFVRE